MNTRRIVNFPAIILFVALISNIVRGAMAQQSSPSLEETRMWLKQAFTDYGKDSNPGVDNSVLAEASSLDMSDCSARLTQTENGQVYFSQTDKFSLANFDPGSIETQRYSLGDHFWTVVVLHSTNASPAVGETVSSGGETKSSIANRVQWNMHIDDPYTPRFSVALKHAILLCGGKRSAF